MFSISLILRGKPDGGEKLKNNGNPTQAKNPL